MTPDQSAPIPPHNHMTRDVKARGVCPACDAGYVATEWVIEDAKARGSEYPSAGKWVPRQPAEIKAVISERFVPRTDEIPAALSTTPPQVIDPDVIPNRVTLGPGNAQYDLAREIFMADNSDAMHPPVEWEVAPIAARLYAYNIAKGLLRAGYSKQGREKRIAVDRVAAAWNDPGPAPEYHRQLQYELVGKWPVLGKALVLLGERFPNARA